MKETKKASFTDEKGKSEKVYSKGKENEQKIWNPMFT